MSPPLVRALVVSGLLVEKVMPRVDPAATYTSTLAGTPPPICTVTVMVCGASTALGSLTVTIPVEIPAASPEVLSAKVSGKQVPLRVVQARCVPMLAPIQVTEEVAARFSDPSPMLYASTVCALPLAPCAIETGPTVLAESRSFGEQPGNTETEK